MSIFHASDEKISDEVAKLAAAHDLAGLARKLRDGDERWRGAAAGALAAFGAEVVPMALDATLPYENTGNATPGKGAWALFTHLGPSAAPLIVSRVLSMETLLAEDIPSHLRYYQRAVAAMGPGSQDALSPLVAGNGPWREAAERALRDRPTRHGRLQLEPGSSITVSLGDQTIPLDEAEEAIRATTRQWAVTCLLGFVAANDALAESSIAALEAAVVEGVAPESPLGSDGLPRLEPAELMLRHESGEKGVLAGLQARALAARLSPGEYPQEEGRRLEDLLVGTLALGVLRKYSHHGVGAGLTAADTRERFVMLSDEDAHQAGDHAGSSDLMSRLAGFALCCSMHLRESAAQVADEPRLAGRIASAARTVASGRLDRPLVLRTVRELRRGGGT